MSESVTARVRVRCVNCVTTVHMTVAVFYAQSLDRLPEEVRRAMPLQTTEPLSHWWVSPRL